MSNKIDSIICVAGGYCQDYISTHRIFENYNLMYQKNVEPALVGNIYHNIPSCLFLY